MAVTDNTVSYPPGEHLAETAAVPVSDAVWPCLYARSDPTLGDEQIPEI